LSEMVSGTYSCIVTVIHLIPTSNWTLNIFISLTFSIMFLKVFGYFNIVK
jgi:hypothetical protein